MNLKVISEGAANLFLKRFAGPFWIRRGWLNKTQWLSGRELEKLQLKLLKRLISHCYQTVPYYKKLMDERCIRAEAIRTLDDIKLFPILKKKDILQAGDSILSIKYPKFSLRTAYTSGTTGTPMKLYRDLFSIGNEHAFVRRQWDWAGIGLLDKCAFLTGRLIIPPSRRDGQLFVYDPFMKELILSTYHLSHETAKEYALIMKQYEVKAIVGYPSAVYFLARTSLDLGIKVKLKAAITSSEILTESMGKLISEAFGCKVFDFYGSAERVCYIHTCENGCYHVIPEYGLTELVPIGDSDSDKYKIISTGFWNLAMPLIRYDMSDIVIKSNNDCPCGRVFQVIKSVIGREADTIKTPSGREFGPAILTHLLYGTAHIAESQIIQDKLDHLTIEYVPSEKFSNSDLENFQKLAAKHLPSELSIDFKQVGAVQRASSGKVRPVVSLIGKV
jgi:phenylacetate-CoA ligase